MDPSAAPPPDPLSASGLIARARLSRTASAPPPGDLPRPDPVPPPTADTALDSVVRAIERFRRGRPDPA